MTGMMCEEEIKINNDSRAFYGAIVSRLSNFGFFDETSFFENTSIQEWESWGFDPASINKNTWGSASGILLLKSWDLIGCIPFETMVQYAGGHDSFELRYLRRLYKDLNKEIYLHLKNSPMDAEYLVEIEKVRSTIPNTT
ncbi:hypothetical protein N7466_011055 [Penicillium verhagenii]|uniref:uncharacterized protein n=1 Tax=Penicillium verhagenii TaxID=1562060 RepID=UPI00254532B7|nr:uncharacterized protein N7466_011055 [Penicillium verhagenii]KAJ5917501.1 hypothetical protein N7466_011055 [Penicillium verhagenii]